MCQRKIIGKDIFKIIPIDPGPNGCTCPTIKQIRDVDIDPFEVKELLPKISHSCRDIKTEFEQSGYPVFFRICECESDSCMNLPPTNLISQQFAGINLKREIWTESGKGLYYEPGFVDDDRDEYDGPQYNFQDP